MTIDHLDPGHGGTWRCTGSDADGHKYSFRGAPSPGRIVQAIEVEDTPGHLCLQAISFTVREGTATVTRATGCQSVQDRDRVLRYDMAEDIQESIERLE